jgi:hypothetical protein
MSQIQRRTDFVDRHQLLLLPRRRRRHRHRHRHQQQHYLDVVDGIGQVTKP